ncbi:MAG: biotin--[acetyl-CoA-carboxylase] ligase [Candidatus Omnitrophica bacterium]|nr:biotin--[acetyl-CoA-carboxylase] ligase [Candidatus Omnitrophota bacterium]
MKQRILQSLRSSKEFLSGEEISRTLSLSRSAVWKHIKNLREDGYKIEAIPRRGYRLIMCPDKLLPDTIKAGLQTKIIGIDIACYDSIGSTMDIVSQKAFDGSPEGFVACAETQTKGRGRLGRQWLSSKGKGLYFSILLRPKALLYEISGLTLLLSVAVSRAIKKVCNVSVRIKWPNDLVIDQEKVAGILTELNGEVDRINFVVVGIGINVNESKSSLPKEATSILIQKGKKVSRVKLLQEILREVERYYVLFQDQGFVPIFDEWRELSETLGKYVRVIQPSGFVEGYAVDIDAQGALLIEQKDKTIIKRTSGEIIHLR